MTYLFPLLLGLIFLIIFAKKNWQRYSVILPVVMPVAMIDIISQPFSFILLFPKLDASTENTIDIQPEYS